jgi:hypothetical protein
MRGLVFEDVVVHPACPSAGYSPRWAQPFKTTFARLPPSVAADGYVRPLVQSREASSRGRPLAGCTAPLPRLLRGLGCA